MPFLPIPPSPTPPQPNPPPPLDFVHVSFIVVPLIPSPHCPLPPAPMVIVRLFLTSMSLVIFCLLFSSVDYVPVKGEVIWYLSLTIWLISLSIMLSSSIHAVAKGRSSFFLRLSRIPLCKCTIVLGSTWVLMGT